MRIVEFERIGEWFNAEWGNRESVSLCAGETRKTLGLKANRRNFTLYVTPICPH
jgi:hypothetical protein